MKITNINCSNLKGSTFEQPLADLTLYFGANFQGKSTRIEALALALCHQLPGIAVRPGDIYDLLASGNPLTVEANSSDGQFAGACWERDKKGKVETTFEGSLSAPALLFNTGEFLDLSPKERTRFLFSVLPPPPLDKVGPDAIVANLKNVKCEPHTEAHEAAVNEFADAVRDSWTESRLNHTTVQDWLTDLVEQIATITKEAKASAKTMRSTALGTVALRQDAPALGPVEAAKDKAQREYSDAVAAEAKALEQFSAAERAVQEAKAQAGNMVDETVVRAKVDELEQCTAKAKLVPAAGPEPVEAKMPTPRPTDTEARRLLGIATQKSVDASSNLNAATLEMKRMERAVKDAKSQTICPTCGHDITEIQKQVVAALRKQLNESTGNHVSLTLVHAICAGDETLAITALANAAATIEQWDNDDAAVREGNRLARLAWNGKNTSYSSAQTRINEATAEIQRLEASVAGNAAAREAAARVPGMENESKACAESYAARKDNVAFTKRLLTEAESAHRSAVADAASARQAQQATERALAIEAKAEVGQALRDMLGELLALCVKQSIGPLVEFCNTLGKGILKGDMAFVDGEVAITGCGPSHKSMSGAERLILYAALSVTLAEKSPVRLIVVDEINRLDSDRRVMLVNRLGRLIADKKIDQAILVDTRRLEDWEMPEGVEFVQVEVKR